MFSPGLSSNYMHDFLKVGDAIDAKPPAGNFYLDLKSSHPVVLIGGGIGMTPMISMIEAIDRHQPGRDVWFFLSLRHGGDHAFKEQLAALAKRRPNVRISVLYSRPRPQDRPEADYHRAGRVDLALLKSQLPKLDMEYFICGPKPMMQTLTAALQSAGVAPQRLRTESFGPAGPTATAPVTSVGTDTVWPITFAQSKKTVNWNPKSKTLYEFADANGVEIQSGCLYGDCGTCMTAILQGEVVYVHPTAVVPDPGTCLPCSCKPKGPLTLDV